MSDEHADRVLRLVDAVLRAAGDLSRMGDAIAAGHGQSAARSLVLGALDDECDTIAGVARRRGLRRQSVQETMRRLEDGGLVRRVEGSSRRSPTFELTAAGRRTRAATHRAFHAWAAATMNGADAVALESAIDVLSRLSGEIADGSSEHPGAPAALRSH